MVTKIVLTILFAISVGVNVFLFNANLKTQYIFNKVKSDPLSIKLRHPISGNHHILLFGDSHAEFWRPFPFPSVNSGVGGLTSAQLNLRADYLFKNFKTKYIILFAGANDVKLIAFQPALKDEIVNSVINNIKSLTQKIPTETFIISTIPPIFSPPNKYKVVSIEPVKEAIVEINKSIRALKSESIIILDSYNIFKAQKNIKSFSSDGIHLNKKGYELLEKEIRLYVRN